MSPSAAFPNPAEYLYMLLDISLTVDVNELGIDGGVLRVCSSGNLLFKSNILEAGWGVVAKASREAGSSDEAYCVTPAAGAIPGVNAEEIVLCW